MMEHGNGGGVAAPSRSGIGSVSHDRSGGEMPRLGTWPPLFLAQKSRPPRAKDIHPPKPRFQGRQSRIPNAVCTHPTTAKLRFQGRQCRPPNAAYTPVAPKTAFFGAPAQNTRIPHTSSKPYSGFFAQKRHLRRDTGEGFGERGRTGSPDLRLSSSSKS